MPRKIIKIPKISCGHCTYTIEQEISKLAGVTSIEADKNSRMVTIEWDEPPLSWRKIMDLLDEIGYPAA
ncbi:MAG: hypothetical protein DRQ49_00985 [Gammaproteobacteria bacterium]|nr:MAG: hypothetical protein DRQ49_00985 [Gammaproteobacteria bacterium]RKZ42769.1 MAG: hypothetical protein DRQ41_06600 [Gammaproteobacteria bacterium]RKZ77183.1 MAG: hypothetical protein DRQ57_01025 [Gammaproteobacteria bacterium]